MAEADESEPPGGVEYALDEALDCWPPSKTRGSSSSKPIICLCSPRWSTRSKSSVVDLVSN